MNNVAAYNDDFLLEAGATYGAEPEYQLEGGQPQEGEVVYDDAFWSDLLGVGAAQHEFSEDHLADTAAVIGQALAESQAEDFYDDQAVYTYSGTYSGSGAHSYAPDGSDLSYGNLSPSVSAAGGSGAYDEDSEVIEHIERRRSTASRSSAYTKGLVPNLPPVPAGVVVSCDKVTRSAELLNMKARSSAGSGGVSLARSGSVTHLPSHQIEIVLPDDEVEAHFPGNTKRGRARKAVPVNKAMGGQKRRKLPVDLPMTRSFTHLAEHEICPELIRSVMKGYMFKFSQKATLDMVKLAYMSAGTGGPDGGLDISGFLQQLSHLRMNWKEQVHREHGFQIMPVGPVDDLASRAHYWNNHEAFTSYYRSLWSQPEFRMLRFQLDSSFFCIWEKEPANCPTMTVEDMLLFLRALLGAFHSPEGKNQREALRQKHEGHPLDYHTAVNNLVIPLVCEVMATRGDFCISTKDMMNLCLQIMMCDDPEVIDLSSHVFWNSEVFY